MGLFLGWLGREQNARAAELGRLLPGGYMDLIPGGQQEGQILVSFCLVQGRRWCWKVVLGSCEGQG